MNLVLKFFGACFLFDLALILAIVIGHYLVDKYKPKL
jgi:hypothetical protein